MPSPDIPFAQRPWRQQRNLNETDFINECRGWDISEVVFSPAMWPTYQPLLRADFTIFDEYEYRHAGSSVFADGFPVFAFWGTTDRRVKENHVKAWGEIVGSAPFSCQPIQGNHLWPLDKVAKTEWLGKIVSALDALKVVE